MLKDKIKALIAKGEQTENKKKIENLAVFLVILVVTLIIINLIWNGGGEDSKQEPAVDPNKKLAEQIDDQNATVSTASLTAQDTLALQLEEILGQIEGVGKVKVLITYSQTSQTVPMYNEDTSQKDTEETDTSGGTRKIIETDVQKEIIYQETDGEKSPIIQSTVSPKVEGAIITAQGATDTNIKANIIQAVEAVTGISSHKIQVFAMVSEN